MKQNLLPLSLPNVHNQDLHPIDSDNEDEGIVMVRYLINTKRIEYNSNLCFRKGMKKLLYLKNLKNPKKTSN